MSTPKESSAEAVMVVHSHVLLWARTGKTSPGHLVPSLKVTGNSSRSGYIPRQTQVWRPEDWGFGNHKRFGFCIAEDSVIKFGYLGWEKSWGAVGAVVKNLSWRTALVGPVVKTRCSQCSPGGQVQSLVWGLRSHILCGTAYNKQTP